MIAMVIVPKRHDGMPRSEASLQVFQHYPTQLWRWPVDIDYQETIEAISLKAEAFLLTTSTSHYSGTKRVSRTCYVRYEVFTRTDDDAPAARLGTNNRRGMIVLRSLLHLPDCFLPNPIHYHNF